MSRHIRSDILNFVILTSNSTFASKKPSKSSQTGKKGDYQQESNKKIIKTKPSFIEIRWFLSYQILGRHIESAISNVSNFHYKFVFGHLQSPRWLIIYNCPNFWQFSKILRRHFESAILNFTISTSNLTSATKNPHETIKIFPNRKKMKPPKRVKQKRIYSNKTTHCKKLKKLNAQ